MTGYFISPAQARLFYRRIRMLSRSELRLGSSLPCEGSQASTTSQDCTDDHLGFRDNAHSLKRARHSRTYAYP